MSDRKRRGWCTFIRTEGRKEDGERERGEKGESKESDASVVFDSFFTLHLDEIVHVRVAAQV